MTIGSIYPLQSDTSFVNAIFAVNGQKTLLKPDLIIHM